MELQPSPPENSVPVLLDRSIYGAHLKRAVVYRLAKQEQRYQEQTHVRDVHAAVVLLGVWWTEEGNIDTNFQIASSMHIIK